ncbi:MAG: molybdopterin-dependent oxidoreductase [Pseudomonadota bacterium]
MKSGKLVADYKLAPSEMTERVTPAANLFVLAHMGIPEVELSGWSVTIDGLVERPLALSLEQLRRRPKRVIEAVHKCAGSPLKPTVPTRQVANVRWGGADLQNLLGEAGIKADATHLWASGLDHGSFAGEAQDCYLKDVPLSRLAAADLLIAYELNGAPLSERHGAPARLVVPGFYGTNSVKWLRRIHLAARRADSLFTNRLYNDPVPGAASRQPVWAIAPESVIVSPRPGGVLPGGPTEVWGWAWSDGAVRGVEVSVDGGRTWHAADVEARRQRSWQRFSYRWLADVPGDFELCSRAADADGQGQPMADARNAVHKVRVTVA